MADLWMRCPNADCAKEIRVTEELLGQFHVLRCPLCHQYIDRRNRRATQGGPAAAPNVVTAEDLKLLGDLKVAWPPEAKHEP